MSDARPDSLFAASVQREPTFAVLSTEFVLSGDYAVDAWDLHPDGDRFILTRRAGSGQPAQEGEAPEADPERHLVVVNWFEELKAAMGVGR